MPRCMSEDVSKVIVQALSKGLSRSQISGVVGVSPRAITRINTNLKKHGTPKAPPKGVKLGRPTKLTKGQAEVGDKFCEYSKAIVAWMAERNHTFYVKDLVRFLRDGYGYVGCDGTVRRCLVRAGYKRKLPWHKSEITTWVPPNHPPVFATVEDPLPQTQTHTHEDDVGTESALEEHDIDPALQDAPQRANPPHRQLHRPEPPSATPYDSYLAPHPGPQHQHQRLAARSPRNTSRLAAHPETKTTHTQNQHSDSTTEQSRISTLQAQIAQQQALILSLQQQLAEQAR